MKPTAPWLGWYFSDETECLNNGDGRKIKVGRTHKVKCTPVLCEAGLHASKHVLDALRYARGNVLFLVELSGQMVHGDDKSAATERTYLARIDAEQVLRKFARQCALDVIHSWDAPDIVVKYLKTGDENIKDAAWDAAWTAGTVGAAARDAARAAARAAASDAAWSATRAAASDAIWSATWSATRAAVRDATRAAESAQRRRLDAMCRNAIQRKETK